MSEISKKHPSQFYSDLTEERLSIIAKKLLDVRHETISATSLPYDDNYTKETRVFGRTRNAIIEMALSTEYSWLSLTNPGMDFTFNIGNVPCRYFTDDPKNPYKLGFFKRNAVDDLFATNDSTPVVMRFVVDKSLAEEGEDIVYFNGYNVYQEQVFEWTCLSSSLVMYSVDNHVPKSKDIPSAAVDVNEDFYNGHGADTDHNTGTDNDR